MRAVIQRVQNASVEINNQPFSQISKGLLVLLGITHDDNDDDIDWLIGKITQMRLFSDNENKMNLSVKDIKGEVMVVSQFTLHASTKKGNRPSFVKSAGPDQAELLYNEFLKRLRLHGLTTQTGQFGAMMQVSLVNDGPVTILIDSKNRE